MLLSLFIQQNIEPILADWETFARTMLPAETMSTLAIRDHAEPILLDIARDMERAQTERQRRDKSEGLASPAAEETGAAAHGGLRQLAGFDLNQLVAEFRALRATVLRLWTERVAHIQVDALEDVNRFHEGIDQALAESIESYSERMAYSRDTFLAILGHDLRNPLSALGGCLQTLGQPDIGVQPRERSLLIAKRSIASIDKMVTNLLEYTRSRLGRGIEVVPRVGDFGALCQEAFDEVRAAHPDMALILKLSGDLSASFDAPRMRQVLINLLRNAVQHGDSTSAVVLTVRGEDEQLRAVFANGGQPIPRELLQTIFDPLAQPTTPEGGARNPRSTSLGLGLYIAREIVSRHGGQISVTSSMGKGTEFTVTLPRAVTRD